MLKFSNLHQAIDKKNIQKVIKNRMRSDDTIYYESLSQNVHRCIIKRLIKS